MIDHVTIRVGYFDRARAFYTLALDLLGGSELVESDGFVEWNDHAAFTATDHEQVEDWWEAMRRAGHPYLGRPGPRPQYSRTHFGAFVRDPDG